MIMSTISDIALYPVVMDDQLTFGEWLEDLYLNRYGGQTEFADAINVAQSTVSAWVTLIQPPGRRNRLSIARVLDVPIDEVNERVSRQTWRNHEARVGAALNLASVDSSVRDVSITITAILPADLARGIWQEGNHGTVNIPISWLGGRAMDDVFAARISGDCLAAMHIVDGDVVICEWAKGRRPVDGDMVVVAVDGEATVKLWYWVPSGVELRDGSGKVIYQGKPGVHLHVEGYVLKVHRDIRP